MSAGLSNSEWGTFFWRARSNSKAYRADYECWQYEARKPVQVRQVLCRSVWYHSGPTKKTTSTQDCLSVWHQIMPVILSAALSTTVFPLHIVSCLCVHNNCRQTASTPSSTSSAELRIRHITCTSKTENSIFTHIRHHCQAVHIHTWKL